MLLLILCKRLDSTVNVECFPDIIKLSFKNHCEVKNTTTVVSNLRRKSLVSDESDEMKLKEITEFMSFVLSIFITFMLGLRL